MVLPITHAASCLIISPAPVVMADGTTRNPSVPPSATTATAAAFIVIDEVCMLMMSTRVVVGGALFPLSGCHRVTDEAKLL